LSLGSDITIWRSLIGGVRLTLSDRSHTLTTREVVDVIEDNFIVQGEIQHTIATPLTEFGVESFLGYRFGNVTIRQGLGFATRSFGQLRAKEELVAPSGAVFTDTRTTERNVRSGALPQSVGTTLYGISAIGLDIALTKTQRWRFTPEVSLAYGFSSLTSATQWSMIVPSIGFRISYEFGSAPDAPPTPRTVPVPNITPTPPAVASKTDPPAAGSVKEDAIKHDVVVRANVRGRLRIEEIEEERFLPILPYMFFDASSATIPSRYVTRDTAQSSAITLSAVAFHHRVLPILAQRLRQYPTADITLVGTTSADEADSTVALARARSVASTLTEAFGISAKRIKMRARRLPGNASVAAGSEAPLADEENRRVEIISTNEDVLAPYRIADTVATMTPPKIIIDASSTGDLPIRNWSVRVNDVRIDSSSKAFASPIEYAPDDAGAQALMRDGNLRVLLASTHQGERVADTLSVVVDAISLTDKRRERRNDSIVERYELVVFPFRRADLSAEHRRILKFVRNRIGTTARVTVEGCTDVIGSTDENMRISLDRARAVAAELPGAVTVIGRGEPEVTVPQQLPEERMLERVVRITAVVPVR
jgi:outer membrane protein OmpA-like peptidoglycan-associated protein